jgi:hypothetical protein
MAGDWIKMRVALPDDSDVMQMADELHIDEFSVCGRLLAVWGWADENTADGFIASGTAARIDKKAGAPGFAAAMERVGWLRFRDNGVEFVGWEVHNSKSAKARAQEAKKKQRQRDAARPKKAKTSEERPDNVPQSSGQKEGQMSPEVSRSKPDTSSLLFSHTSSPLGELEGPLPDNWETLPDPQTEASEERIRFLVSHPALGFGWNDCVGALDKNYRDIPTKHRRAWESIRGDPELWPLLCEAMRKLKSGVGGLTFSLGTVLSEEGIRKVIGIKNDGAKSNRQLPLVGLNRFSGKAAAGDDSPGELIGGPAKEFPFTEGDGVGAG